jgi:hypothetical protein
MAKKFDGVIEAVRYNPDGQIALVRGYELRGVTYSDRVLLDRDTLMKRIKDGKKFAIGQRKEYWASTFEYGKTVKLVGDNGNGFLTTHDGSPEHDDFEETPVF